MRAVPHTLCALDRGRRSRLAQPRGIRHRKRRHLLAAQAARSTARSSVQTHVVGLQRRTPTPEEVRKPVPIHFPSMQRARTPIQGQRVPGYTDPLSRTPA